MPAMIYEGMSCLVADKNINTINPIMRIFAAIKYLVFGTSLDEI